MHLRAELNNVKNHGLFMFYWSSITDLVCDMHGDYDGGIQKRRILYHR